jgi:hypothetical protein
MRPYPTQHRPLLRPFFLDIEMTDSILTHLTKQAEERGADLSTLRALAKLKDVEQ